MRKIRNEIIIIHKDSTKRFNQLYRMLRRNPHLGLQFHFGLWSVYILSLLLFPFEIFFECYYCIWSYPPIVISYVLHMILCITIIALGSYLGLYMSILFIISLIVLQCYHLSGRIFPKNIELSRAYYRDMFDSNPDLDVDKMMI